MSKEGWTTVTLGDIAENISVRVDDPSKSGLDRFVGLVHLSSGSVIVSRWDSAESVTSTMKRFQAGDVLLARRNAHLRRASAVDFEGVCSGDAYVLREKPDAIVPGLLKYILNTNRFWEYAIANADGSMSTRVKWKHIIDYKVRLQSTDNQIQSLDILEAMVEYQTSTKEVITSLETCMKKVRQNSISELSHNNDAVTMADCCDLITKGQSPRWQGFEYTDSGMLFITSENVGEGELLLEKLKYLPEEFGEHLGKSVTKPGDLLINIVGSLGRASLAPEDIRAGLNQAVCVLRPNEKYHSDYLLEVVLSLETQRYFLSRSVSTAQPNLTLEHIRKIPIPEVSLLEQKKLASRLKSIRMSISSSRIASSNSRIATKSCIDALLEGSK